MTEEIVTTEQIEKEIDSILGKIRIERQPNKQGLMILTQFLAGLMYLSDLKEADRNAAELVFWITHNGDGTLITPKHESA